MVNVTRMADATHSAQHNIPPGSFSHVAGYVSGTPDIEWTADDWARYPLAERVRIAQNYGKQPDIHDFDVLDIERLAYTPAEAAAIVRQRVDAGIQWTTLYGGDSVIQETNALIRAMGDHYWIGHVDVGLADWNLNEAEASKLVGTEIHGATCRYVQWASPESNPHTLLPGTSLSLSQANVDLCVVDTDWHPSSQSTPPPPPPPPPVPESLHGILVILPDGSTSNVVSSDGGHTWNH